MKLRWCKVVACVTFCTSMQAGPDAIALDAFLKVSGIDGESDRVGFEGWSDVLGFNINVQRTGASPTDPFGSPGTVSFSPMFVQKYVDSASPRFFGAVLSGQFYQNATIDVRHAGPDAAKHLLWEFQDVLITSYSTGQSPTATVESLALDFARVRYSYWPQNPDGSTALPVTFGWDRRTNRTWTTASGGLADFALVTDFRSTTVPEPNSMALATVGMVALLLRHRRSRHANWRFTMIGTGQSR